MLFSPFSPLFLSSNLFLVFFLTFFLSFPFYLLFFFLPFLFLIFVYFHIILERADREYSVDELLIKNAEICKTCDPLLPERDFVVDDDDEVSNLGKMECWECWESNKEKSTIFFFILTKFHLFIFFNFFQQIHISNFFFLNEQNKFFFLQNSLFLQIFKQFLLGHQSLMIFLIIFRSSFII